MAATKGLAALREKLTKTYGEEAVTAQEKAPPSYRVFSTGIPTLDYAMGTGGLISKRVFEYWGPEGVGKTTASVLAAASAQRADPRAIGWIDMEQSFDWDWASHFGLNTSESRFLHVFPDHSEDVSDQLKLMADSGEFSMIILDSIGGMESMKAFEKKAEESNMGKNAQIITRMVKQSAVLARKHDLTFLMINQVRANFSYGGSDISAGPKTLKHATTMKVRFARGGEPPLKTKLGKDEIVCAKQVKAKVERNKVAIEGRTAEFWLKTFPTEAYGPIGVDQVDQVISVGDASGVFERAGSYYKLWDGTQHLGKAKLTAYLRDNPELLPEIEKRAMATRASEVDLNGPSVEVNGEYEDDE